MPDLRVMLVKLVFVNISDGEVAVSYEISGEEDKETVLTLTSVQVRLPFPMEKRLPPDAYDELEEIVIFPRVKPPVEDIEKREEELL